MGMFRSFFYLKPFQSSDIIQTEARFNSVTICLFCSMLLFVFCLTFFTDDNYCYYNRALTFVAVFSVTR